MLGVTPEPLLKFGTIALYPAPYRRVIGFQAALLQELFDIAQRQRVSKVPANRTKNDCRLGLPPFEDCWSSRHGFIQPISPRPRVVATLPQKVLIDDCGHLPQLEKPAEFNRLVTNFLKMHGNN